ncbi:MAG: winged helix-turn-helix domain-containing protein [Streptosporangiaceae bacterium]
MSHPVTGLETTVHQRVRLGILAVVLESKRVDFSFLRDTLDVTDGNLSRHLHVLEEAGYIEIEKVFEHRRPRTWVRATPEGRSAFDAEVAALRALLVRVGPREKGERS